MLRSSSPAQIDTVHTIARYIEAARTQQVQPATCEAVFRCVLDLLGAAAAGIRETGACAIRESAYRTMDGGDVPIWFSGLRSSVIGAAWANSAAAAALDLDDGHRLARGHPGAAVIPTALATAQAVGATLDALVSAIVIGYEVGVTIGAARLSYGNTGTWAPYAVVATAGALRGSSCEVLAHALAIAGESAPNQLFASAPAQDLIPEGSDVKEGIPWSVVTGLIALDLAEAGHTGPRNILDSALHYRFSDDLLPGSALHINKTYFKLYACCRHVHAPLDAMVSLMRQHAIAAQDIDAIEVDTYGGALRISNMVRPNNLVDVQYSIPYCLALVAFAGPQALLPLTAAALEHEAAVALASKVTLSLDPELDAHFPALTLARVTITSRGQRFVSDVTSPRGESTQPLSWAELEEKLIAATRGIASDSHRAAIFEALNGMRAGSLTALFSCLEQQVLLAAPAGASLVDIEAAIRHAGLSLSPAQIVQIHEAWPLVEIMLRRIRNPDMDQGTELAHVFRALPVAHPTDGAAR